MVRIGCFIIFCQLFKNKMAFEMQSKTIKWLLNIQVLGQNDIKQITTSSFQIKQNVSNSFQNGVKVSQIVQEIFKKSGLPIPQSLNHLKVSNQTAAQLFNWNILNEALKKIDFQIDPLTKNMIINGDREHLAFMLRQLHELYSKEEGDFEDSLQTEEFKKVTKTYKPVEEPHDHLKESLTLSRSQEPPTFVGLNKKNETLSNLQKMKKLQAPIKNANKSNSVQNGDLLEYVIEQLMTVIKLTRKQAIALLSDNNKYLAHVFVKGIKNEFTEIEELMERWFKKIDYVVQKMVQQNDMCFFFLQVIKPTLLSKSQEVAQWGCRILSRIAHELANKQMLPLAYDWFVRQAGGLATTILALSRHPKLNQHVVGYILQFARFNVAELFTVQLKKITSNDQISYVKFMLLIFDPLSQSKISSEELLSSGAIDYWIEMCLKGAEVINENSIPMRLYSIEFLTKIWRAHPLHIQQTLDKVNDIMGYIKRGIRQQSQIMKFTLLELLFNLLDQFASKRNPYASIVYKKITFLFIENHQELNMREFMLRNFSYIISKYQTIPIQIFLQPFIKQVKIRESKSYFLNIFDMEFINVVVNHKKLKVQIALELFDLLAKTKLNNYQFAPLADSSMEILLDRFLEEDIFHEYTSKLVKISLAIFYSTFKHKKVEKIMNEQERLHAQKRAQIINFIISLVQRHSDELNEQIKEYIIHLKLQIQKKLNTTHKGIERILDMFPNIQQDINEALEIANNKEEVESNMTSQNSKNGFHFPKLQEKYLSKDRDQTASQHSNLTQGTQYSKLSKQEFPQKDYSKFVEQDEQKFIKQNGIGFKKKSKPIKKPYVEKQVDPKVQEQIFKKKIKKEQEEKKRIQQQQKIQKRKQQLKIKIQKELQQRNLMQGIKGFQRDVQVKILFDENQINEKLFDEEQLPKNINISDEEYRDQESIRLILKKYNVFLKKLFNKYASSKVNKKDFFNEENQNLSQIDLVRMCKEKNLEKNKQVIIELVKNNKENKSLTLETFIKFVQNFTIFQFTKEKCSTHMPMGDYLKSMLKKMSVGQNFKLEEDEDQTTKSLTQKVRYNPHIELPQNYKKIYERVYEPKKQCSYPTKKAIGNESYIQCYEVVNELLYKIFKVQSIEEEVRFFEEARIIKKANMILPPRPNRKEEPISLLEEKEPAPMKKRAASNVNQTVANRNTAMLSTQRQKQNSKPKAKIVNQIQKKKQQQEQQKRLKKQKEEEQYKKRQQQIKQRYLKMQQEKEKEKSRQIEEKTNGRETQEQKRKKEKQQKEKYHQQNKQKIQKFKREKQQKDKEQKQKMKELKSKQEEERKQKMKIQMKKQEQKRKEQAEKNKKQRQFSEEKNKKKKQEEQKKKENLKKQVMKKLQGEKQKYQIQKLYKQLLKKIFMESDIQGIYSQYKEQLKNMYNYGKQFNEYKLGTQNQNLLEQKGWMTICQQFNFCDSTTANNLLKQNQKQKGRNGFMYDQFLQNILNLAIKKDIENDLDDYEKAHQACVVKLQKYLKSLKIPKDKQSMKDYFVMIKNNMKKKEEIQLTAPNGQKQTWQVEEK